jgi:hypothetical protein
VKFKCALRSIGKNIFLRKAIASPHSVDQRRRKIYLEKERGEEQNGKK